MKKGARTCAAHAHRAVTECGGCFYSPAATGHPELPLELMELPLGFFPPQTGPAGGDPPPSAVVTPPPSQLLPPRLTALPLGVLGPRGSSRRGRTTVMTLQGLARFTWHAAAIGRGQRSFPFAPDEGGPGSGIPPLACPQQTFDMSEKEKVVIETQRFMFHHEVPSLTKRSKCLLLLLLFACQLKCK